LLQRELAKVAANAFLATKISFINAMAEVCDAAGADVTVLGRVLGADPRIGPAFLNSGLGFGGGCLPKDIRAFTSRAAELGAGGAVTLLREVDAINLRRRARVAELACDPIGGSPAGEQVCVLGAAFNGQPEAPPTVREGQGRRNAGRPARSAADSPRPCHHMGVTEQLVTAATRRGEACAGGR
jgi:UDPglucose 6-dehydrogenase